MARDVPLREHIDALLAQVDLRYQQRCVDLKDHFEALLLEKNLRDQQRYDAQIKALEAALLAQERAVQTAMTASEKAVAKAEVATEKRLEGMNEFRGALQDQTAQLVSRVEYESLSERHRDLAARLDRTEGRSGGLSAVYGWLIGGAGLVVSLVVMIVVLRG